MTLIPISPINLILLIYLTLPLKMKKIIVNNIINIIVDINNINIGFDITELSNRINIGSVLCVILIMTTDFLTTLTMQQFVSIVANSQCLQRYHHLLHHLRHPFAEWWESRERLTYFLTRVTNDT